MYVFCLFRLLRSSHAAVEYAHPPCAHHLDIHSPAHDIQQITAVTFIRIEHEKLQHIKLFAVS